MNEGYKETEIGEILEEWKLLKLKDICQIIDPQPDHRAPPIAKGIGYPYIGIGDVNPDGSLNFYSARKIEEGPVIKQENQFTVELGDIVFCKVGTVGLPRMIIPKGRFALSATLILIKPQKIDNYYLYYFLDSDYVTPQMKTRLTGTTRATLGIQQIREFLIITPPLPEQHCIATVLATLDKAIEKTEALIAKLQQVKAGLMQDLLTKGIDELGRIRSEATHVFKDTEIGRVPIEWDVVKAINIFIDSNMKPQISEKFEKFSLTIEDGLIPKPDRYNRAFLIKKRDEEAFKLVFNGEIVYNPMNLRFGAIAISKEKNPILVSTYYNVLKADSQENNPWFYAQLFSSKKYKYIFESIAIGTLIEKKRVHWSNFSQISLPNPPNNEQRRIASVLTTADERIVKEEAYLDKLRTLKKGLMADLLTGRVRVPEGVVETREEVFTGCA